MSELLKTFTTMKIGGPAERLIRLKDLSDLKEILPRPIRVLGNGSNILIDDRGLKGTVIVVRDFPPAEPEVIEKTNEGEVRIRVSGGLYLPSLCRWAERKALTGCEYMIGIPGTVGGAVVQNAGANEQEMADILETVEIFDLSTQRRFELSRLECGLTYRHSKIKDQPGWLVISAVLRLKPDDLQKIADRIQKNIDYRKQKTPSQRPSLGSVFTRLSDGQGGWIFPGKLIEDAGLKGERLGGAQISSVHANYITNEGHASFDDVMGLIHKIEQTVKAKFGIKMNREILIWSDRLN